MTHRVTISHLKQLQQMKVCLQPRNYQDSDKNLSSQQRFQGLHKVYQVVTRHQLNLKQSHS